MAVCRDETKVVLALGASARPDIAIYDAAGGRLGRVVWDGGRVLAAGWTDTEGLVVIDDRGRAHRFTVAGAPDPRAPSFSLGAAAEREGLAEVEIAGPCVVARTGAGHFWAVGDVAEPRAVRLPDPTPPGAAGGGVVHAMCPVPPALSPSGALEVLVAVDGGVVVLDADGSAATPVGEGPIVRLAVAPDGSAIAGYAADDVIYLWSPGLEDVLAAVAVGDTAGDAAEALGLDPGGAGLPSGPPDWFVWCGRDGVAASWAGVGALLVTLEGAARWWDLGPGPAALVGEVDGARAVTGTAHWLLRRVPPAATAVGELGSTSPGALLHDARQLAEGRDPRAAAGLLDVLAAGDLATAATACLGAAAAAWDPPAQESLLRAGCYGRAFLALDPAGAAVQSGIDSGAAGLPPAPPGKEVVALARELRALNALRAPEVALPLTAPQLRALGVGRLAARLTGRRHYLLALRVCGALGGARGDVLLRWACDKIAASASSAPDDQLLAALTAKLEGQAGVKWAAVAAAAQAAGRPRLAAALAQREAVAAEQVPLLLALGEEGAALRRAAESGDPDLGFEVAHASWRRAERSPGAALPDAQRRFWDALAPHPAVAALFLKFLRGEGGAAAAALAAAAPEAVAGPGAAVAAAAATAAAPDTPDLERRREWAAAREAAARDERAGREDARFEGAAAAAALRLAEVQAELERSTGREGFAGLSVADTVRQCLRLGARDAAARVSKEFKIPERQAALLAIDVAAAAGDWAGLQAAAGRLDRRSPVTVDAYVAAARAHGAPVATVRWFVDRIQGEGALARRAQLYAELGLAAEAAALAEQAELAGAGAGVLGSLRDAVGGTMGSLMGRMGG